MAVVPMTAVLLRCGCARNRMITLHVADAGVEPRVNKQDLQPTTGVAAAPATRGGYRTALRQYCHSAQTAPAAEAMGSTMGGTQRLHVRCTKAEQCCARQNCTAATAPIGHSSIRARARACVCACVQAGVHLCARANVPCVHCHCGVRACACAYAHCSEDGVSCQWRWRACFNAR